MFDEKAEFKVINLIVLSAFFVLSDKINGSTFWKTFKSYFQSFN